MRRLGQEQIERAASLIDQAKRPLAFCGHGVIKACASEQLLRFAEKTGVPVACTLLGLGAFPASHPLSLGMMGMHGEAWVNHAVQEADLLIAVGMRFDDRVTGNLKNFAHRAKKIHLEIDPAEVNKNVKADVALMGDLRRSLERLIPAVRQREHGEWRARIADFREDSAPRDVQGIPHDGQAPRPPRAARPLAPDPAARRWWSPTSASTRCGRRSTTATSGPRSLITSGGLGTMGFALPGGDGRPLRPAGGRDLGGGR